MSVRIGLIGDYNPDVPAHRAIPLALSLAGGEVGIAVEPLWIPTEGIQGVESLEGFNGLWGVPASPYKNMDGALLSIQYAREQGVPYLGSCGGFQHAVIECARNVLGWEDADHAETTPDAQRAVIGLLHCALVEHQETIHLQPGTRLAEIFGTNSIQEGYNCRYGINPEFQALIVGGPLKVSATGAAGEIRAVELEGHPLFIATLFQSERKALEGVVPPLVKAFVIAAGDDQALAKNEVG